jgi:hypothetical protein
MSVSLERLLTKPTGFDLAASPLQIGITRAADGLPLGDDLSDEEIERHFGCERSAIGLAVPVLVVVVAGVRGGKSLLAACAAVKGCLASDLSKLKVHEIARFAIVAPTTDNATATFRLLVGNVMASPKLKRLVVGEPSSDTLVMRRPDGHVVEIVVVAASRGAVTLRSRWLVGFVLDEVALFGSEPTGAVVNAEELLRAAETRLVPAAQGWLISSPFGPQGLLYELYRDHFGKPGRVLVVHAPTRALNPTFPAETVEAIRARQPDVAAREYDAAWIDAETAFYNGQSIDRATREGPLVIPFEDGHEYACVIDPGFRSNAWTMALATQRMTEKGLGRSVVLAKEWQGSKVAPLRPREVFTEIANDLRPYGVTLVWSDQASGDALRDVAEGVGLTLVVESSTQASKLETYSNLATLLETEGVDLPPVPRVKQDLLGVRKRVGRHGVSVDLMRTPDGRHSDFAPSVAGAIAKATTAPTIAKPPPVIGSPEWIEREQDRRRGALIERQEKAERYARWFGSDMNYRGRSASWRR